MSTPGGPSLSIPHEEKEFKLHDVKIFYETLPCGADRRPLPGQLPQRVQFFGHSRIANTPLGTSDLPGSNPGEVSQILGMPGYEGYGTRGMVRGVWCEGYGARGMVRGYDGMVRG